MLVSVNEFRAYMGGLQLQEGMQPVLESVIKRAQTMVETILNRPVEKVQVREIRRADSKGFLYLSVTPVWKVIACGGTTVSHPIADDEPYEIVPDPDLGENPRIIDKVPSTPLFSTNRLFPGRLYVG